MYVVEGNGAGLVSARKAAGPVGVGPVGSQLRVMDIFRVSLVPGNNSGFVW